MESIAKLLKIELLSKCSAKPSVNMKDIAEIGVDARKITLMVGTTAEKVAELISLASQLGFELQDDYKIDA